MSRCLNSTELFSEKLANIYINKFDNTNNILYVQEQIKSWLQTGIENEVINKLFYRDFTRNFPIWWSGFFIEDPNSSTNPIKDMKDAALNLNGFSSLDIIIGEALNEQNQFWSDCYNTNNFNYGTFLSTFYTLSALNHKPKNIGLFLNKESSDFLRTYFFKTEIELIDKVYSNVDYKVVMHIFNLKQNCSEIIDEIKKEKNIENIIFKCYQNCNTLTECVQKINMYSSGGNKKKFKKRKTRITRKKCKRKTIKNLKNYKK